RRKCRTARADELREAARDLAHPLRSMERFEIVRMPREQRTECILGRGDRLAGRSGTGHARRGAHPFAYRIERALQTHHGLAREHRAGESHRLLLRYVELLLQPIET